ncbi:YicC family protein [Rhizobiaceae bacterium BDR2-2]|uniref:YicC family protein n=1 Tax=Ectorhizobium quercum TaxID=2965071 RepID=A0AAE3N4C8_9HYPH|nr:YicC/YloC family endoribonuclease [Ectorhizobium quercum]MCX8999030.1 YicC family protein [Ectorhizobium quercum]
MALRSMTGFARSEGESGRYRFAWELRAVNGKGLDLRLRLPPGLERLEAGLRRLAGAALARGNVQAGLTVGVAENRIEAVVNRDALDAVLALKAELGASVDPAPLRFDSLLGIRGLIDFREAEDEPEMLADRDAAMLDAFQAALDGLNGMREREGTALATVLAGQLDQIAALADRIEADPSRQPAEIVRRIAGQVAQLMEANSALDQERLHAEAALLATRADIREELDRLRAHCAAARELLAAGGPVGRKLDFLAQEFNRESNTICSKSNAVAVTSAGIELKVVIDQFREQVQNLE